MTPLGITTDQVSTMLRDISCQRCPENGHVERFALAWSKCDPHLLDGIDDLARIDTTTWGQHDIETPISGPVLVVRADPQLMPGFRPEDEQRFRRTAPQARFVVAQGSGHNIHEEQLDWFGDQVEAFLATV